MNRTAKTLQRSLSRLNGPNKARIDPPLSSEFRVHEAAGLVMAARPKVRNACTIEQ